MLPYIPQPIDDNQRKAAGVIAKDLAEQIHGVKPRKGLYTLRVPEGTYNLIALFLHHIETSTEATDKPILWHIEYFTNRPGEGRYHLISTDLTASRADLEDTVYCWQDDNVGYSWKRDHIEFEAYAIR